MEEEVYCTLVLTDGYLPGAQVLAHSLRDCGTTRKLAVLIGDEGLSEATIKELERIYDYVIPVPRLYNKSPANLMILGRLELSMTFTKIKLWSLCQFSKIVYLDADVLALEAPDELFKTEATFAACPDVGWPDCFNSGVMVLSPNMGTYHALLNLAERGLSFDGADQGLLNMHFRNWHRLPFIYNVTPSASYQYTPAYRHYGSNVRMVHFIGADKPWLRKRLSEDGPTAASYGDLVSRWWAVWDMHYRPLSEQDPAVMARASSQIGMPTPSRPTQISIQQAPPSYQSQRPSEYDPNFRRDHNKHDDGLQGAAASWQPPPKAGRTPEVKKQEPKLEIWQPPPATHFDPPVFQHQHHHESHKEEQVQQAYVPPIYLPKETVPYVPREMPYSMYSQTQVPETAYHHPQEYQKPEMQHPQFPPHPPPPAQFHQPQPSHPVHRRFSLEDIQERVDKALPFPPALKAVEEEGHESQTGGHKPFFASSQGQSKPAFEAPLQNWDPARFSPPPGSAPEAKNFATSTYEWNASKEGTHFVAPRPMSPPKNLHFQIPSKAPSGPSKIFPWESRGANASTRFFVEDNPRIAPPPKEEEKEEEPLVGPESPVDIRIISEDDWATYSLVNAWDKDPEISRYVESFQKNVPGGRRSGTVTPKLAWRAADLHVRDDAIEGEPDVVPPQLPVTPNPIRGRSWRSNVLNDEAKYPSAKGIPSQQDWDPEEQLAELKNAPNMMLQKRSPPSPSSVGLGSPRSPGEVLVSSSVPVPQLPHMITAHMEGHRRASLLAQQQLQHFGDSPGTASDYALPVGVSGVPPGAIRPIPKKMRSSATQTDSPEVSDKAAQCNEGDFGPKEKTASDPSVDKTESA